MNKKGFTLVELLAVIAILSVLVLITSTAVTKMLSDSKTKLSNTQIALIKSAAETWGADNIMDLPNEGECKYITLKELKEYGLLDDNVIDPKTGNKISNDLKIKITTTQGKSGNPIITYEVNPDNVEGCKKATKPICELVSGTPKTYGAAYNCTVKKGVAYKFYVLSRNDSEGDLIPESSPEVSATSYNLIMSANITPDGIPITSASLASSDSTVNWISKEDYLSLGGSESTWNQIEEGNYSAVDVASKGPVSAMNYLYEATKDWTNIPNIELNYMDEGNFSNYYPSPSYIGITTKGNITSIIPKSVSESISPDLNDNASATYINLKARLPKSSELSNLRFGSGNEFLYDNLRWAEYFNYSNYIDYCTESSSENFGSDYNCIASDYLDSYLTLSSYKTTKAVYLRTYGSIFEIDTGGMIETMPLIYKSGIRPVITLSASELK